MIILDKPLSVIVKPPPVIIMDYPSLTNFLMPPPKTRSSTTPAIQSLWPQTLHDLLKLYAETPLPSKVEDEVELYEMALTSNDADKTLAMFASISFWPCELN